MQELRTFVEEGGVVLVAFEDEVLAFAEMKARAKIFGDATDQERWLQSSRVEDPRQHRCCRGLAVGSSNDQHFFTYEEFVVQQLRQRTERNALIEDVFQFHVARVTLHCRPQRGPAAARDSWRQKAARRECLSSRKKSDIGG